MRRQRARPRHRAHALALAKTSCLPTKNACAAPWSCAACATTWPGASQAWSPWRSWTWRPQRPWPRPRGSEGPSPAGRADAAPGVESPHGLSPPPSPRAGRRPRHRRPLRRRGFRGRGPAAEEAGWDVQGLFMSNWEEDDDAYCTAAEDYQDARAVAAELGIPLHRVSFAREYRERVFAHFLAEHSAGRTPNPDVLCNREIKFGVGLAWARRLGATHFATGHYARLLATPDGVGALQGARFGQGPELFPAPVAAGRASPASSCRSGRSTKAAVRERARRAGPARLRQARQHRHLLHRRAPVPGFPGAATWRAPPAPSRRRTGKCSGPTRDLPSTPWASARA